MTKIGYKHTDEAKRKIRENHSHYMKGRKIPLDVRKKMSLAKLGSRCHWWRGGVTEKNLAERKSLRYKIWREHVFNRDDYTCQSCGKRGIRLVADHELPFAYFPQLRYEILNGRTLCKPCHYKTETYGNNLKSFALMNGWVYPSSFTSEKLGAEAVSEKTV